MILDIIGGFAILFLACSIGLSAIVIGVSIVAPLFIENKAPVEQARYIKVNERSYDFDED